MLIQRSVRLRVRALLVKLWYIFVYFQSIPYREYTIFAVSEATHNLLRKWCITRTELRLAYTIGTAQPSITCCPPRNAKLLVSLVTEAINVVSKYVSKLCDNFFLYVFESGQMGYSTDMSLSSLREIDVLCKNRRSSVLTKHKTLVIYWLTYVQVILQPSFVGPFDVIGCRHSSTTPMP